MIGPLLASILAGIANKHAKKIQIRRGMEFKSSDIFSSYSESENDEP